MLSSNRTREARALRAIASDTSDVKIVAMSRSASNQGYGVIDMPSAARARAAVVGKSSLTMANVTFAIRLGVNGAQIFRGICH